MSRIFLEHSDIISACWVQDYGGVRLPCRERPHRDRVSPVEPTTFERSKTVIVRHTPRVGVISNSE